MHAIVNTLHDYNRYLILAALLYVLFRSFTGMTGKKPFEKPDNTASLVLLILSHVQLLLGLIQYFFTSAYTQAAFADMKGAMKDSLLRYFAVEHFTGMLIAIVLIHLGRTKSKKATSDPDKHKRLFTYTAIATGIILAILGSKGIIFGNLNANNL
jgi:hypothetical protein